MTGFLERADRQVVSGWAATEGDPAPVLLELLLDDVPTGILAADQMREDLRHAGIGSGRHGFVLRLPGGLSTPGTVAMRVRRAADGAELPGSPHTLAAADAPPQDLADRHHLAQALEAAAAQAGPDGIAELVTLLARQAASLLFTHGTALAGPPAALLARWGTAPPPIPDQRPRALFIDERLPDANRDAGSQAALSHMRALGRLGWRVDFVATTGIDEAANAAAAAALQNAGITVWQTPWIASVEEALARLGPALQLVYAHRLGTMQSYGALVRRWCPHARLVYCLADLHHLRLARRLAIEAGAPIDQGAPNPPAEALRVAELLAVFGADAVITHSSHELALLAAQAPGAAVHLVPWEVPPQPTRVPFAERRGVGFIGSYGHPPNLDAAQVLVAQIMPVVWAQNPAIPCVLAGTDLPAALRQAAEQAAGPVEVLGRVDRPATLWGRVRLACAPLR